MELGLQHKASKLVIVAVIPCYNEELAIGNIVEQCLQYVDAVIVSDDQSTDRTVAMAMEYGAQVIQTTGDHGPGKAYRIGILKALSINADVIITLDGDGQHNPSFIPALLEHILACDMVNTSRFLDNNTAIPVYRKFGIWMITIAFNFGNKIKLTDSQCSFRAYRRAIFNKVKITENGFGYSTEILIKIRKNKYCMKEIPTIVKYFGNFNQNSSVNPVKHGLQVLFDTIKWRIICELLS